VGSLDRYNLHRIAFRQLVIPMRKGVPGGSKAQKSCGFAQYLQNEPPNQLPKGSSERPLFRSGEQPVLLRNEADRLANLEMTRTGNRTASYFRHRTRSTGGLVDPILRETARRRNADNCPSAAG
jgi:hypothetical protein